MGEHPHHRGKRRYNGHCTTTKNNKCELKSATLIIFSCSTMAIISPFSSMVSVLQLSGCLNVGFLSSSSIIVRNIGLRTSSEYAFSRVSATFLSSSGKLLKLWKRHT